MSQELAKIVAASKNEVDEAQIVKDKWNEMKAADQVCRWTKMTTKAS